MADKTTTETKPVKRYKGESPCFVPLPDGSLASVAKGDPFPAEADPSTFILPADLWG